MGYGRPTKYKKKYCKMLIEHMSKGLSFASFAADVEVNEDTLYEWSKRHPSFSEAKSHGRMRSMKFWEELGIKGAKGEGTGFSAAGWIFNMKNRFSWVDKRDSDDVLKIHSVKIELPSQKQQHVISMEPQGIIEGDTVDVESKPVKKKVKK